jgi:hypothetical protein
MTAYSLTNRVLNIQELPTSSELRVTWNQGGFTKGERASSSLYTYIDIVHAWSFSSDQWRL